MNDEKTIREGSSSVRTKPGFRLETRAKGVARLLLLALALAAVLTACDLLSGGAPRVLSSSPADGETGVPTNTTITAELALPDGPLNVTTLTDTSASLTDSAGELVAATRVLSDDGETLTVTPAMTLERGATYTFSVTSELQTAAGTGVQPYSSSFTTGDGTVVPSDSDLVPDRSPVVFTAGGETDSDTRTLTLSNSGDAAVDVTSLTISGAAAAQFTLADDSAFSLQPNESKALELGFNPGGLGPQLATLTVESNDSRTPTLEIPLGGLSVEGQGGDLEPSLQWILDAYGLPIETGDEDPGTTGLVDDASNALLGDEVIAQSFTKAPGTQSVSVQVLAAFGVENTPVFEFGYYTAGDAAARTPLFEVQPEPTLNAQRLGPDLEPVGGNELDAAGNISFDPGSAAFGLYSFWPSNRFFSQRTVYSENRLNTFADAIPHQVRAYPLKNSDGSVEPNAYVLATEEFTQGFDYNDVVAIIRNVVPQNGGQSGGGIGELQVSNTLGLPSSDRLLLHHIQNTSGNFCNEDPTCDETVQRWAGIFLRNTGTLKLQNLGSEPLELTISVADPGSFTLPNNENIKTLAVGESYDLQILFAPVGLDDKQVVSSSLDISAGGEQLSFELTGIYQRAPEGSRELYLGDLVNDGFGYPIDLGANSQGGLTSAAPDSPLVGSEVRSDYWQAANPGSPVTTTQIAAFHTCCQVLGDTFELYARGNTDSPFIGMRQARTDSSTIYPREEGSEDLAQLSANANTPFDIRVSGYSTNPALGRGRGNLGVRMWPLIDPSGNPVANTYLISQDYVENGCGTSTRANCDYNDNMYIIENVTPAD